MLPTSSKIPSIKNLELLVAAGTLTLVTVIAPFIKRFVRNVLEKGLVRRLEDVGEPLPLVQDDVGTKVNKNGANEKFRYDIVIIGGGTAGCVLASRISENQDISVLLLESGISGFDVPESRIPLGASTIFHTQHGYQLWTEPQEHAGNKKFFWPRARLLGGCSSINAMMYHHGAPSNFDEWASILGPEGESWRWLNLKRYFHKFEKFVPHKLFPEVDISKRNLSGAVEVGYFGYFSRISSKFLEACEVIGIPLIADFNTDAGPLGASKIMTYIDSRGRRVSSESAYITKDVLARPNLKVAISATVTRILFDSSGSKPRAIGVEFTSRQGGTVYQAMARREVVLSAGAVHTPQVLMLSGIGPSEQLKAHFVPVVVDMPGVGSHLLEHPSILLRFRVDPRDSIIFLKSNNFLDKIKAILALGRFYIFGTGPLTCNTGEAVGFVRSTDARLFPPAEYGTLEDTTSGADAPDLEIFASPVAWKDHGHSPVPGGGLMTLAAYLTRPTSKGTILLRSTDPFDVPIIDPRYLNTKHDIDVLVRGVKLLLRIAQTNPLRDLLIEDSDKQLDHYLYKSDDKALEFYVRENMETIYHPTSTARMAPLSEGGVVNSEMLVYGVSGLRIVDASIFPTAVCGHTAAACFAIAEKAAELIKNS